MIADVRCVVTRRACARKRCDAERIVHASDVCDREAACIEDLLSSRHGFASSLYRAHAGSWPGFRQASNSVNARRSNPGLKTSLMPM